MFTTGSQQLLRYSHTRGNDKTRAASLQITRHYVRQHDENNFDSISDAVDRVSDAVDSDLDKVNTNNIKLTYDNASDTNTGSTKYDQNMKGAPKDTDTKDNVQNDRYDNTVTQTKWSTETNEIDNRYLRDYDNIHRQMEDRQNDEYYKAQRQIHSAIMGDTPVKTVYDRQYILTTYLLMIVRYKEFQSQCTIS